MKWVAWLLALAAPWLCLFASAVSAKEEAEHEYRQVLSAVTDSSRTANEDYYYYKFSDDKPNEYRVLTFEADESTPDTYQEFLAQLRDLLRGSDTHGIPTTADPGQLTTQDRYILLNLTNGGMYVTLAMDASNAYIVGYEADGQALFLSGTPTETQNVLFPNIPHRTLPFSGSYTDLESPSAANQGREDTNINYNTLLQAISSLYKHQSSDNKAKARAFLVIIQMVAEAARFVLIEQEICERYWDERGRPLSLQAIAHENSWRLLSRQVQESSGGGAFAEPVNIGQNTRYDNVVAIVRIIGLLLSVCRPGPGTGVALLLINTNVTRADDDDTCPIIEPVVNIVGRNGLCVDVRDGVIEDNQPVQLWPCNKGLGQQWTQKADGTIQSGSGRLCLSSTGRKPGVPVVLRDCTHAASSFNMDWEIWDNGNIVNPGSALVLEAKYGSKGTALTLQTNTYAAKQGWRPSVAYSGPQITSLVVELLRGFCLRANIGAKVVDFYKCASGKKEQQWAFIGDGSIRPSERYDLCLTASDYGTSGSTVTVASCSLGTPAQRWVMTYDGYIEILKSALVLDVEIVDSSGRTRILISDPTEDINQRWYKMLY